MVGGGAAVVLGAVVLAEVVGVGSVVDGLVDVVGRVSELAGGALVVVVDSAGALSLVTAGAGTGVAASSPKPETGL